MTFMISKMTGFMDDEMVDDITSDEDDGFMGDEPDDEITSDQDETIDDEAVEADTDDFSGPGPEEIAFLGAMSEEIAEEKKRRAQIRREMLGKNKSKE